MYRESIASLLREAQLLADHAVRTGQLPAHSRIFEEIDALAQAVERDGQPAIAPLIAEMQKVSRAAQITCQQLMRRQTPLGRLRLWVEAATPYLLGFVTLLLTLYLAFQSSELHKADLALREYEDLVSQHPQEKIYLAWKMYSFERVLNTTGPPLAQLDGYQKLIDDTRRLYAKRAAVQRLLVDSSVVRYVPELLQTNGPCWLRNLALTLNSNPNVGTYAACRESDGGLPERQAAPGSATAQSALPRLQPDALDCDKLRPWPIAGDKRSPLAGRAELDNYLRSIACFVEGLQISEEYDSPMDSAIYATRNKVNLLVTWLLPGLYGLVGACVYLMRDLLRVGSRRRDRGDTRVVHLLSLLLRVALGGLAGIIIGWFWVPASSVTSSTAIAVSSVPFGLAFLAGLSIESLFALLDRLNRTLGQSDGQHAVAVAEEADRKG